MRDVLIYHLPGIQIFSLKITYEYSKLSLPGFEFQPFKPMACLYDQSRDFIFQLAETVRAHIES
jgi:hypothetical protein